MKETMIDTKVTYALEHGCKFFIVENVPARVCKETGEQFFAPETVEQIQGIIKTRKRPDRMIETPCTIMRESTTQPLPDHEI
jgi:YgiT-type zinc finger domain-containing protein